MGGHNIPITIRSASIVGTVRLGRARRDRITPELADEPPTRRKQLKTCGSRGETHQSNIQAENCVRVP